MSEVNDVWKKGHIIPGYAENIWRKDDFGNVMKFSDYGETTKFGWEIDHIKRIAHGGSDNLSNKRPLYWKANRERG